MQHRLRPDGEPRVAESAEPAPSHETAGPEGLTEIDIPAPGVPEALTEIACKLVHLISSEVVSVRRASRESFRIGLTLGDESEPAPASAGGADLTERLVERGFARPHEMGLWALGPPFLGVMEGIDDLLHEMARESYGAPTHSFPALIATDTLRRAGYVGSPEQNASALCHVPHDLDLLVGFPGPNAGSSALADRLEPATAGWSLPPSVCYHRFHDLADVTLPVGSTITARGACFRYDARHDPGSLSRLWSFQMREIVYAGDDAYVRAMAERGPAALENLLAQLGLVGSCESASDPLLVNVVGQARVGQVAAQLKFELRLPLGAGESLAAGSLNLHDDHFGKAFAIRLPDGTAATSGCTAFGLERLALGFFAQHGLEEEHWPDAVASRAKRHVAAG